MAKNWKNFLPPTTPENTQETDNAQNLNSGDNGQNLQQALNALGIKNNDLQSLLHEREQLEQTMKGLTQPGKEDDSNSKRYEQYIPSFKEKKEADKKWQAFRDKQASKKLRERQLNKIKAKTAFSDTDEEKTNSDYEAPRFSEFREVPERKKKNEEDLRKTKVKHGLQPPSLKIADPEVIKQKLTEKKKEFIEQINKENRIKALQTLKLARQKLDKAEKTIDRINAYSEKTKTVTRSIEKKLNEAKDFYNKLDQISKKTGNDELTKTFEKANELIGADKLQSIKKVTDKAEQLKHKIINPVNDSWEKINDKRRELLSIKSRFQKKTEELLSLVKSNDDLDEKREQLKKLLNQKKALDKKQTSSKEKDEPDKKSAIEDKDQKDKPKEKKEKDIWERKSGEKKEKDTWEEKRERKKEERRERKKNKEE
ncbi:MAG: hypothetical protein QM534_07450 [Sediminibacterium sp.]|nr:hypothetical protein [Sediminibacterium sp.]